MPRARSLSAAGAHVKPQPLMPTVPAERGQGDVVNNVPGKEFYSRCHRSCCMPSQRHLSFRRKAKASPGVLIALQLRDVSISAACAGAPQRAAGRYINVGNGSTQGACQ